MRVSFAVYSIVIGSDLERSCLYVIVALEPELLCLESWGGVTSGSYFAVYSIIIGSESERSSSFVILSLGPELSCLGSRDVELHFTCQFGEPDRGFLWKGYKGIICGGGDGRRYVGTGVTLDRAIVARRSLRRLFTITPVGRVLPIFKYLEYCVLILDWKSKF